MAFITLMIKRSGCFAVNSILPVEAILLSPFMCDCIAIIATILAEMMQCVDSAAALKCNGSGLLSWLAGHFEKGSVRWRGPKYVNACGSVGLHWERVYSVRKCTPGLQSSFISSLKLTNQKCPKVTCVVLLRH